MKLASPLRRLLMALLERLAKRVLPDDTDDMDGTESFPLSRRREQLIKDQIDSATSHKVPPPPSSRYN